MLAAAVIVFREALEAALIVGIVLAATKGVIASRRWIAGGVGGGFIGAALVAMFADRISDAFGGSGQDLFNAAVLAAAVLMLAWHNIWMKRHGRELAEHVGSVAGEVRAGGRPLSVLAVIVGIAVLREGAETVLFLYGIIVGSNADTVPSTFAGGLMGLGLGAVAGGLLYLGLLRIPGRYLFSVTGTMVTLLAAGLAAQAVTFVVAAGLIDSLGPVMWDSSWLLSEGSLAGRLLHTLIGYIDHPTLLQLVVYVAVIVLIPVAAKLADMAGPRPQRAAAE